MVRAVLSLMLVALCAAGAAAQGPGPAGGLRAGPGAVTGELENGLRYVVVEHRGGRGAVWLHVGAGSMRERAGERGLASLVRRLVLASPAHFEPGEVERLFTPTPRLTGRPEHATTSYDRSVFALGLGGRGAGVDEALIFCADALGQAAWSDELAGRERDALLEFASLIDRSAVETQERLLGAIAPGSSLIGAWPGGRAADIAAIGPGDARAFWSRWYTPANAAVVVVCDEPPASVVARIERTLGGIANRGRGAWEPRAPEPTAGRSALVLADEVRPHASASVLRMSPAHGAVRTRGALDERVLDAAAAAAVRLGLERAIRENEMPGVRAEAEARDLFGLVRTVHAGVDGTPGEELALVRGVRRELGRAGLDASERRAAWREVTEGFEAIARNPDAGAHASWYTDRVSDGDAPYSPRHAAEAARRLEQDTDPDAFVARVRRVFGGPDCVVVVESGGGVTEAQVLAADEAGGRGAPGVPAGGVPGVVVASGVGGAVEEITRHAGTGVTGAWITGGVRVLHRPTDVVPGRVFVRVVLAGGVVEESALDRGVTAAVVSAFAMPATGAASSGEVARALSAHGVSLDATASADAVQIAIDAPAEELAWVLGLVRAVLSGPRVEGETVERWRDRFEIGQAREAQEAYRALGDEVRRAWYPEEGARFQPLTEEQAAALDAGRVQAWAERVAGAPMSVAIVGDVVWDEALEAAAGELGNMSARARIGPGVLAELRRVPAPARTARREVTLAGADGAGAVAWGVGGPGVREIRRARAMVAAGEILSERIKARLVGAPADGEGGSLAAWASYRLDDTLDAYARLEVTMVAETERIDGLVERAEAMAIELGVDGPTEAEMAMFRERVASYLDNTLRDPAVWAHRLALADLRGRPLDDFAEMREQYMAVDAGTIREELRRAMAHGSRYTVIVRPGEDVGER